MQHGLVFDVWVYRRDSDAVRYLILRTSVEKAEKWFNGGRFWQIPSNLLADGDTLVPAVRRCLDSYGIDAAAIWAVEHTYTTYNRRFDELELRPSNRPSIACQRPHPCQQRCDRVPQLHVSAPWCRRSELRT